MKMPYDVIRAKDREGIQPMYRPKNWNLKSRELEKRTKKENWFKKKGEDTVIFIPATPNSELKKEFDRVIRKGEIKIKVVERAGKNSKVDFRNPIHLQRSHVKMLLNA